MDEMYRLNPRFVMLRPSSVEVVSWRKLVDLSGRGWVTNSWRLLNDDELPEYNSLGPQRRYFLRCWRNGEVAVGATMTTKQLGDHFLKKHDIVTMTEDDYFIPLSKSLDCLEFVRQTN